MPEPPVTVADLQSNDSATRKESLMKVPVVELRDNTVYVAGTVDLDNRMPIEVNVVNNPRSPMPVEIIR